MVLRRLNKISKNVKNQYHLVQSHTESKTRFLIWSSVMKSGLNMISGAPEKHFWGSGNKYNPNSKLDLWGGGSSYSTALKGHRIRVNSWSLKFSIKWNANRTKFFFAPTYYCCIKNKCSCSFKSRPLLDSYLSLQISVSIIATQLSWISILFSYWEKLWISNIHLR